MTVSKVALELWCTQNMGGLYAGIVNFIKMQMICRGNGMVVSGKEKLTSAYTANITDMLE